MRASIGAIPTIVSPNPNCPACRTDIEPLTDMRFIRVEDTDSIRNAYNDMLNKTAEGQVDFAVFQKHDQFDPYRLGELRLNNESRYNNKLVASRAPKTEL